MPTDWEGAAYSSLLANGHLHNWFKDHHLGFVRQTFIELDRHDWARAVQQSYPQRSDKQRQISRLLKKAWTGKELIVSHEVPLYFYSLDFVLTFRQSNLNVAVEVENKHTKWFRTCRLPPEKMLRKILTLNSPHNYKGIELDTRDYPLFEKVSDSEKAKIIREAIQDKLSQEERENRIYRFN